MITNYVFNKSNENSILLIHGLYANAGFWLRFLPQLKQYRIIILDVDYSSFLKNNGKKIIIEKYIEDLIQENAFTAIVSHSLGTIVSQNIITSKSTIKIEICPVFYSIRKNNELFINHLNSLTQYSKNDIRKELINIDKYIDGSIDSTFQNVVRYVPTNDNYFEYVLNNNEKVLFEGDHFNIYYAIQDCVALINPYSSFS